MHDYSRIIIFLWTTTLKKPKMSLRCAQNFSQCCFSPPVQTDLLRWDYLSEDLGKMWYHHFLHKEQAVFCGQTLHFGDSVKRLWVFLTQNILNPPSEFLRKALFKVLFLKSQVSVINVSLKYFMKIKPLTFFMESLSNKNMWSLWFH